MSRQKLSDRERIRRISEGVKLSWERRWAEERDHYRCPFLLQPEELGLLRVIKSIAEDKGPEENYLTSQEGYEMILALFQRLGLEVW